MARTLLIALVLAGVAAATAAAAGLDDPAKKEVAMQLVSSAENSSLDWRAQFSYIEDIGDGRGYTAGIIGFCSGTGDMLGLVEAYTARGPAQRPGGYLPACAASTAPPRTTASARLPRRLAARPPTRRSGGRRTPSATASTSTRPCAAKADGLRRSASSPTTTPS